VSSPEAALSQLGEALGVGDAPRRFFEAVRSPTEPYELGVALTLDGEAALVSYNPRVRGGQARGRMLAALDAAGLGAGAARAAFELAPDARCSTVLGLEWRARETGEISKDTATATLYLEEIARFFQPKEAARRMRALAALAGTDVSAEAGRAGPLYIWALDLTPSGASAFKVYRTAGAEHAAGVRGALRAHVGGESPSEGALFGGAPTSGYIVQKRYRGAEPAPLKIYKCYPYLTGAALDAGQAEVAAALSARGRALMSAMGVSRPTSLGLRFRPGVIAPAGGTAYWCLALNSGATAPATGAPPAPR